MLTLNPTSLKRRVLAALTVLVVSTAIAAAQAAPPQNPAAPDAAARIPRVIPDPYAGKKKLLVIADVQSGFQHDSINHALEVIGKITRDSGVIVSFIRSDSQLVTKSKVTASSTR